MYTCRLISRRSKLSQHRKYMRNLKFLVLLVLVFPLFVSAQTLDDKIKEIDAYAENVITTWKDSGAGMAIAIVKDGKVVLSKGYGVRQIGKPE